MAKKPCGTESSANKKIQTQYSLFNVSSMITVLTTLQCCYTLQKSKQVLHELYFLNIQYVAYTALVAHVTCTCTYPTIAGFRWLPYCIYFIGKFNWLMKVFDSYGYTYSLF